MKQPVDRKSVARIGNAAVQARTGKTWTEWLAALDAAGAAQWDHPRIVAYLRDDHGLPAWWRQMVAVGYEQERGLRQVHEGPTGSFEICRSKTVAASPATLFRAWHEGPVRRRWLKGTALTIRKATPEKLLRLAWDGGTTSVEITFSPKGEKTQVTVQHRKLADAKAAARMKAYWAEALERLKRALENGQLPPA
jgi:uncharacterized protein YndB with AHSA1/START domain